jgi:hypothetical protein
MSAETYIFKDHFLFKDHFKPILDDLVVLSKKLLTFESNHHNFLLEQKRKRNITLKNWKPRKLQQLQISKGLFGVIAADP